ncbi:hypothetical protein PALA49_05304 [Pseudomonas aeruginosa]|nr:hypothetical protein [Pseudomonas aeruginosa]
MKVMKWSAIALAVSAGSTQFAVADAFVSDDLPPVLVPLPS